MTITWKNRRYLRLAWAAALFFLGNIWLFSPGLRFPVHRLPPQDSQNTASIHSTESSVLNSQLSGLLSQVITPQHPQSTTPQIPDDYYFWATSGLAGNIRQRLAKYVGYVPNARWNRNIIQAWHTQVDASTNKYFESWEQHNPDFKHTLYIENAMAEYVRSISDANNLHEIGHTYFDLLNKTILRQDFFRYIALWTHGGIWGDIDTWARQPFDSWLTRPAINPIDLAPVENLEEKVGMIVGVEHYCCNPERFGLTQHVFAAKKGHPVLLEIIAQITEEAGNLANLIEEDKLSDNDVLQGTGPELFARIVEQWIKKRWDSSFNIPHDLRHIESPTLYGDILILPNVAFHSEYEFPGTDGETRDPNVYVGHESTGVWSEDRQRIYRDGQTIDKGPELAPTEQISFSYPNNGSGIPLPFPSYLEKLTGLSDWPDPTAVAPFTPNMKNRYDPSATEILPDIVAPPHTVGIKPPLENYPADNPDFFCQTFDDGPTNVTSRLLDSLASRNQKNTFFQIGSFIVQNYLLTQRAYSEGHEIALHTWSHHPGHLVSLSGEQIYAELAWGIYAIHAAIGQTPKLFRPPYGSINDDVRRVAAQLGLKVTILFLMGLRADDSMEW